MKNFQITAKEDGRKYWIGRSIAVSGFIFKINQKGIPLILANKRGVGLSNHVGLWNCPCGYLDWDESGSQAMVREVFEECNLNVIEEALVLFDVESNPSVYNQNVSLRYLAVIPESDDTERISIGTTGEKDEVSEVKWIPLEEVENYQWAFNHNVIIKNIKDNFLDHFIQHRRG
jgi:ADP-ribose pyrophosphatase YjhB (NUDIX family)